MSITPLRRAGRALIAGILLVPLLSSCANNGTPQVTIIRETVPPITKEVIVVATPAPGSTVGLPDGTTTVTKTGAFSTPHPILSDVRVRQAIAYCTNRPELISSVYGFLTEEQRNRLVMDTFLPQGHWALATENITKYPFDPEKGRQLLDAAGWKTVEGDQVRYKGEDPLALKFLAADATFVRTWATVMEQQLLENCGIQLIRTHAPVDWFFGPNTGLSRRDFELSAYSWVGQADPGGVTLYTCNQIPLPDNGWSGQNVMGWCNDRASKAMYAANNTLDRAERKRQYGIVQEEFTKDMVSLPIMSRIEAVSRVPALKGLRPDPTEYYTTNVGDWEFTDGKQELIIGSTGEPSTLYGLTESSGFLAEISRLFSPPDATTYNYDYQPNMLSRLPTVENGGAKLTEVDVKPGDTIWNTSGERAVLKPGVEITLSDGSTTTYTTGTVKLRQLSVTFVYTDGMKWEDGQPFKKEDFELGYKTSCDKDSGAISYVVCDSYAKVDFVDDKTYTITYLPGALWPEYSVYTIPAFPAHLKTSDGRLLKDIPAKEWLTLPEMIDHPLSSGPYRLVEWVKGQRMIFEANPNYFLKGSPKIKRVTIQFYADSTQAIAQLLTGNVDVLGQSVLSAGPEVEAAMKAGEEGKVDTTLVPSSTWQHMDFNLYEK